MKLVEGCFVIVVPPRADGLSRLLVVAPARARLAVWSILPAGGNHTSGGSLTAWLLALLLRNRRSEHLRVTLEGLERSCALRVGLGVHFAGCTVLHHAHYSPLFYERVPSQFWLKLLELSVYKQFATPFRIRHRDASNGWIYGCIYHCCERQAQDSKLAVL